MARLVDDGVHLIWQTDNEPGSNSQSSSTPQRNDIMYVKFASAFTSSITNQQSVLDGTTLSIYPNPNTSDIIAVNVQTEQAFIGQLELSDMLGQRIQSEKIQIGSGSTTITKNISTLAAGLYFLHLQTENGERLTQKIVVQK